MATTTQMQMQNRSNDIFSTSTPPIVDSMTSGGNVGHPEQSRSSSLSDIEDRAEDFTAQSEQDFRTIASDPNDTEAETERLEDSPQKMRKTQNLLLTATNSTYGVEQNPQIQTESAEASAHNELQRDSDAASSSGSSVGIEQTVSMSNSPRKRKRPDVEEQDLSDQRGQEESRPNSSMSGNNHTNAHLASPESQFDRLGNSREESDRELPESEEDIRHSQTLLETTGQKSKRRTRKASNGDARIQSPSSVSVSSTKAIVDAEAQESNCDDLEMEDVGEHAESENIVKDEEITLKKKSAMDSLSAIEKCFARLREKLYDERLAKCDAELAMLAGPTIAHPELLSMKVVLEQRRDEKIRHEDILLKYKLGSLQNKSKAEKAQVHGQYMQSVREIRDRNLEQANKEWYQIHKEKRNRDDDVPEYMYQYPTRRSQQITHQTAYNKEVSLLSGIAKYRGFPAAPEICGAKPSETDSDFEKMGILQPSSAPLARHPPTLRASLSANAILPRPRAVADEHFLEQNPWANPQHPAHLHRQASAMSMTTNPQVVPSLQKRHTEPGGAPNPAPTHAETGIRSYLPIGPTPATVQDDKGSKKLGMGLGAGAELSSRSNTPDRHLQHSKKSITSFPESQKDGLERPKPPSTTMRERAHLLGLGRSQGQEIHVRPYIPKVPRKPESPSSSSTSRRPISPTSRFPIIKAEDRTRPPSESPTPQHFHRPVSLNVSANGAGDRFTTS